MTKTGENIKSSATQLSNVRRRKKSHAHGAGNTTHRWGERVGLLLAALLALSGCSLAMPDDGELFASNSSKDDGGTQPDGDAAQLDAAMDAAALDDGAQPNIDSALASEAGSDGAAPSDAGVASDAAPADATQDAALPPFNPDDRLVTHYRFNETSGNTVNDFAGDKDAILVGTPADFEQWVSPGRIGGALRLSGQRQDGGVGHHVELPQGPLLGLQECSISIWVNRATAATWQRVFDFGGGTPLWLYFTPQGELGLPALAGRTAELFVDYKQIPIAPVGEGLLRLNQPIPVSTWTHFVLTWSAAEIKVYLNGKLVGQTVPFGRIAPTDLGNTTQNYLGRSQYEADAYYNGLIDEFRLYSRVLTASDVAQLYELQ